VPTAGPSLIVVIALYPGVTHLDFTGPHQVLSRAPSVQVLTASMGGQEIEAEGLVFARLTDLANIDRCDVLLAPGGTGTAAAIQDPSFMAEIGRLGASARYITSVCTGSLILAAAGFLKGKRATCHWASRQFLRPYGVQVSEARVERDGNILTGGGVTAGIDFAFVLLAELVGETYAKAVQLRLEYAPDPPFQSGRPELAPPEVLELVRQGFGRAGGTA
jgi:putative intracellular protease/amidase